MRARAAISRRRARRPISRPRRGRIALVATTAQFHGSARAGDQRYDTLGHPGVNGFRHKQVYEVDAATLAQLREIGERIGWEAEVERRRNQGDPGKVKAHRHLQFSRQDLPTRQQFAIKTEPNPIDLRENVRQVKHARASRGPGDRQLPWP